MDMKRKYWKNIGISYPPFYREYEAFISFVRWCHFPFFCLVSLSFKYFTSLSWQVWGQLFNRITRFKDWFLLISFSLTHTERRDFYILSLLCDALFWIFHLTRVISGLAFPLFIVFSFWVNERKMHGYVTNKSFSVGMPQTVHRQCTASTCYMSYITGKAK